jgi:tRNA U34 5-methylaminomethyl-2-thiouridine-forming methyltransferase MnmC
MCNNVSFKLTEDGSHTLYLAGIDETYHSIHGAINESRHVFINAGLSRFVGKKELSVLEVGFGTGLNALLTAQFAKENNINIHYTTVEKFPLNQEVYCLLNYGHILEDNNLFNEIHSCSWNVENEITANFKLQKMKHDLKNLSLCRKFDCIYFDAFSPEKQPDLWTKEIFEKLFACISEGGILTTYCAKGAVRRTMQSVGFNVERIPGPEGKREIIRAIKSIK